MFDRAIQALGDSACGHHALGLAVLLAGCSLNPVLIGQIYSIVTPREDGCQPLELHFVVDASRMFNGTLSPYAPPYPQPALATLSGTLSPDGSFQIIAKGTQGHGNTTLTGRFTSQVSTITINGPVAGPACDGRTFTLYLGQFFRFAGGGGGGGGR